MFRNTLSQNPSKIPTKVFFFLVQLQTLNELLKTDSFTGVFEGIWNKIYPVATLRNTLSLKYLFSRTPSVTVVKRKRLCKKKYFNRLNPHINPLWINLWYMFSMEYLKIFQDSKIFGQIWTIFLVLFLKTASKLPTFSFSEMIFPFPYMIMMQYFLLKYLDSCR